MNNELIALLKNSVQAKGLGAIAEEKRKAQLAKASFLLLDCSGSMAEYCEPNRTKIDALRELTNSLKKGGLKFTQVIFPGTKYGGEISAAIPDPRGSTPLHAALEIANLEDAKHIVVISDGIPDNESAAINAAQGLKTKGVKIDVFYVGPYPHPGEQFLRSLATITGGKFQQTTLMTAQKLSMTNDVRRALMAPKS